MNKQEFLDLLKDRLSGLPSGDVEERLSFWSEIIDDRMEEGLTESEAVAAVGSVEEISAQIISEFPLSRIVKEKAASGVRLRAWEIVLLCLGSPIWLSLLIAAFAIVISVYAVLWTTLICLWTVPVIFAAGLVAGVAAGVAFIISQSVAAGIALIGLGILCSGLAIFSAFGCLAATRGTVFLSKEIFLGIKLLFVGRRTKK